MWLFLLNPSLQFGSLNASGLIKLCHQEVYRTIVRKEKVNLWGWAAGAQMYTNTSTHFSLYFQINHETKLTGDSGLGVFIDCSFVFLLFWVFFNPLPKMFWNPTVDLDRSEGCVGEGQNKIYFLWPRSFLLASLSMPKKTLKTPEVLCSRFCLSLLLLNIF